MLCLGRLLEREYYIYLMTGNLTAICDPTINANQLENIV